MPTTKTGETRKFDGAHAGNCIPIRQSCQENSLARPTSFYSFQAAFMSTINISDLKKADVLAALYNASRPLGRGFLSYNSTPMSSQALTPLPDPIPGFTTVAVGLNDIAPILTPAINKVVNTVKKNKIGRN